VWTLLAIGFAGASACGADTEAQTTAVAATATKPPAPKSPAEPKVPAPRSDPGSIRRQGPYRFTRPPVVVQWRRGSTPPLYEVYFRINRRLSTHHEAVFVKLNGSAGYSTNGLGYDDDHTPNCYAKGIDTFRTYARSLRRARPGDLVRVTLRFTRRPRGLLSIRVPLRRATPQDPAPGDAYDAWWHSLGCR
jgi:hypothetical protein